MPLGASADVAKKYSLLFFSLPLFLCFLNLKKSELNCKFKNTFDRCPEMAARVDSPGSVRVAGIAMDSPPRVPPRLRRRAGVPPLLRKSKTNFGTPIVGDRSSIFKFDRVFGCWKIEEMEEK